MHTAARLIRSLNVKAVLAGTALFAVAIVAADAAASQDVGVVGVTNQRIDGIESRLRDIEARLWWVWGTSGGAALVGSAIGSVRIRARRSHGGG